MILLAATDGLLALSTLALPVHKCQGMFSTAPKENFIVKNSSDDQKVEKN